MQTWYECKVKYLKIDQGGFETKVNDNYLIDAVSYTDAESRVFEIMKEITRGEFQIVTIRKSNITEVISKNDGEWWYKAKINMVTIDEEKGKEKKATQFILIMADDIHDALKQLEEGLSYMLIPYVTTALQLSNIADVFPYVPGDHLKKVFDSVTRIEEEEEEEIEEEEIIEEEIDDEEEESDDQPEEDQ